MPKLLDSSSEITPRNRPLTPQGALIPEVIDSRIADVEALARWLDYAFVLPGGFRFGIAGIIGLIPGIGDIFDALISLYIVVRAINLGRLPPNHRAHVGERWHRSPRGDGAAHRRLVRHRV